VSGWHHAPPPGSRSGVADYAERLDRAFAGLPAPGVNLYHVGNNGLHREIYRRALETPGVVVLHDAVLHHFLLGTLDRDAYIAEFVHNYGEWRRDLAAELWDSRASSGTDPRYFEFALLRRLAGRSRHIIVHNPGAARIVRDHGAAGVTVIPHFFEASGLPDACDAARFRQQHGIAQSTLLFGVFGYLRETKRLAPTLAAFRRLHAVHPDSALLLAGEPVSPGLARFLDSEAVHPAILRLGHLSERGLLTAAEAVDCCVNLRYPAAGETSGIAIRLMGIGKPVILSEGAETANIPEGACLKVRPGPSEAAELFELMALVAASPALARAIGFEARGHLRTRHSLDRAAALYRSVLAQVAESTPAG